MLVELKARFDEENNITWAEELEHHGVHVAYGLAGLKTHCKVTLVVRREPTACGATCIFPPVTTTPRPLASTRISASDLVKTSPPTSRSLQCPHRFAHQDEFRKIWVAPGGLRNHFLAAIDREIAAHRRRGNGHLIFKMNSLVDRAPIQALYAASRAGVQIDLIVRGACCLRPGVPGWSENIRVLSVIGRFLEHSRIYYFGNGGNDEIYMGSADLMERNLDRRIEVVFPVEDQQWAEEIRDEVAGVFPRLYQCLGARGRRHLPPHRASARRGALRRPLVAP